MEKNRLNRARLDYIKGKLKIIEDLFFSIAVGKYNVEFHIPEKEDEFTRLYVGIKLMLDSSKEELNTLKRLNRQLLSI